MTRTPDPNKMKRVTGPKLTKAELRAAKVRITTYLDQDILEAVRRLAQETGMKYQALLNQILRNYLLGKKGGFFARLDRLEKYVFREHRPSG